MSTRGCAELVQVLGSEIGKGVYAVGQLVPSSRELSTRYGVCPETARKGLKALEEEGLLVAEPRRGFRVAPRHTGKRETRPVAFATDYLADLSNAEATSWAINNAIQRAAAVRGWSALGAHSAGGDRDGVLEQLISSGAWGVVVDSLDPEYYRTVCRAKLPVVMVNSVPQGIQVDTVVQDNYSGGCQAAMHLIASGAERIGWFGSLRGFGHTRERYAGALAGLAGEGRELAVEASMSRELPEEELRLAAREFLEGRDRPDGVLAFDLDALRVLVEAAGEVGLVPEKDFRMVGWLVEESLAGEYAPIFRGGPVPPAMTWKASSMADWALTLLAARRDGHRGEPVRINVPTRLELG
jgi:DNA-binding LacI/PurR family transcriptional regulator